MPGALPDGSDVGVGFGLANGEADGGWIGDAVGARDPVGDATARTAGWLGVGVALPQPTSARPASNATQVLRPIL
jgi:hypothetical protein